MASKIKPCEITPEQRKSWDLTMSVFSWQAPGLQHLFYKLISNNDGGYYALFTRDVPIAATDGKNILINPDTFFRYKLKERVFIVGHEVFHNVFDDVALMHTLRLTKTVDCGKYGVFPVVEELVQQAADYRINALLVSAKIGTLPNDPDTGEQGALFNLTIATEMSGFFDTYAKLYKKDPQGEGKSNGFDINGLLESGISTGQTPSQVKRNEQQWALEVQHAQTLESSKGCGGVSGGMKRAFQAITEPEISWQDQLATIARRMCGGDSYNWRKPDRRFIVRDCYMPSRSGYGAGWLVIWMDISGSRSDSDTAKAAVELVGIVRETMPRRLTVVWGDSEISEVDEVADENEVKDLVARSANGGGGTDVKPIFSWIRQQESFPDMFVGFTDGYFFYPAKPEFPVVWASSTDYPYPYGQVVRVK